MNLHMKGEATYKFNFWTKKLVTYL